MENNVTNFNDVLKNSFLNNTMFGNLSATDILLGLLTAFMAGAFIYAIYKYTYKGVLYSPSFNMTLILMTMITSLVIMTISTNVVLSLGMVGALSIVRFRTAIKDPLDVVFMFWAITAGISSGAGLYLLTLLGALIVGGIVIALSKKKSIDTFYLLVIHYEEGAHDEVRRELQKINYTLKSKIIRRNTVEFTAEVRLKVDNTAFMNTLNDIEGVQDVSLVQYNGDYAV
ncbi:DUF4956 domain-containing protein [Robertmurraya korlensis]|uniref:DUF4956 domain-containing protein n=1 Tax=Robertmurraya korlensis TaxID=519977 RepID=UPI000825E456|nr:DUF4956 domain-containing protein [Robertmurraya korlensis]